MFIAVATFRDHKYATSHINLIKYANMEGFIRKTLLIYLRIFLCGLWEF